MKVIITGSKELKDYELLKSKVDIILSRVTEEIQIITGGERQYDWKTADFYGCDYLAEKYAREKGYKVTVLPLGFDNSKEAITKRNYFMLTRVDALIAFHDSQCPIVSDLISQAETEGLKVRVINVSNT